MSRLIWKSLPLLSLVLFTHCAKPPPTPDRLEGTVQLSVSEEFTSSKGERRSLNLFSPSLRKALESRGVAVVSPAEFSAGPAPVAAVTGKVALIEPAMPESKVGGPVPFHFVEGIYDLEISDAVSRQKLGRIQGPLDIRVLKERALPAAHGSTADTLHAIADAAAPGMAEQLLRPLWIAGKVYAAGAR